MTEKEKVAKQMFDLLCLYTVFGAKELSKEQAAALVYAYRNAEYADTWAAK